MQRENFYILLNLSVDPPDTDPGKIEQAIKKKQSEWSRMRNHPSKGIQAQHNIGMISEIRNVMLNPKLREKEAEKARKILTEKKKEKYSGIDRHLDIRMSKGFITDEEIKKLAQLHHIPEEEINKRLQKKEEKKYAEIDKHIRIRMKKGYITEGEISKLSKIHKLDGEVVRRRVRGPIKKMGAVKLTAKPLDQSIEKVIKDNLKVVGKSSLYDFLDLHSDVSLEQLQQKAKDKEAEILKIRKKDGVASATGVLVGHCISIFKKEKSRASYDATMTRASLAELNSDIDVAGMDGTIRSEYFDILVKRAIELGMDPDEASKYIRKYCKHKNWDVEKAPKPPQKKKKNVKIFVYAAIFLVTFLLASGFYGFHWLKERQLETEYENLIAQIETMDSFEDKIQAYKNYLASHNQNKYSGSLLSKINEARTKIQEKEVQEVLKTADEFIEKGNLDKAMDTYNGYMGQNPRSSFTDDIRKNVEALSKRIEANDYRKLDQIQNQGLDQKITAYHHYLQKHPEGSHRENVINIITDLSDAYYTTLKDELQECAKQKAYKKCIDMTERFIQVYPKDTRSKELKILQDKYREKLLEKMVLVELRKRSLNKKNDLQAAKQIYLNYLKLNPNSPINPAVQKELARLENEIKSEVLQAEKARRITLINDTKGHFVLKPKDVVIDTHTGLMWTLWDSKNADVECMDYDTAEQYVKTLKAGGYQDWRLPTAIELIRLYDPESPFPFHESPWYWTSESYKSYQDGWIRQVNVIISQKQEKPGLEQKDSRECGAVRAVRH